jgi:hypothetical protein
MRGLVSIFIYSLLFSFSALAAEKPHRILIVLDGSATMDGSWNNMNRFKAASHFINQLTELMYTKNDDIEFSLRLYGHLFEIDKNICNDTRREVAFSKDNRSQIHLRLEDLNPLGAGSINYAINMALWNELKDTARYQYSIIVLTDDNNSCKDDYCAAIKQIPPLYKSFFIDVSGNNNLNCFKKLYTLQHELDIPKTAIDIVLQYPAKEKKPELRGASKKTPLQKPTPIADTTANEGFANIINTDRLHTVKLYFKAGNSYKEIDEVFFYGADSKKIKLTPGYYKVSIRIGRNEKSREFKVVKGMITDVRMQE